MSAPKLLRIVVMNSLCSESQSRSKLRKSVCGFMNEGRLVSETTRVAVALIYGKVGNEGHCISRLLTLANGKVILEGQQ